jgi:hypothetical protein
VQAEGVQAEGVQKRVLSDFREFVAGMPSGRGHPAHPIQHSPHGLSNDL